MKHRISPATVMSALALFFSLGGVGLAASGYRITSIWQIKPSVRHALKGEHGAAGPQGLPGSVSWSRVVFAASQDTEAQGDWRVHADAVCPSDTHVIDGGYDGVNETVEASRPNGTDGWSVVAYHAPGAAGPGSVRAWALCAP